jgi:hypothetical protein
LVVTVCWTSFAQSTLDAQIGPKGLQISVNETLQIGAPKDFDPEVYRQKARDYKISKAEACRKAYYGSGNILVHSSSGPPPSTSGRASREASYSQQDYKFRQPHDVTAAPWATQGEGYNKTSEAGIDSTSNACSEAPTLGPDYNS